MSFILDKCFTLEAFCHPQGIHFIFILYFRFSIPSNSAFFLIKFGYRILSSTKWLFNYIIFQIFTKMTIECIFQYQIIFDTGRVNPHPYMNKLMLFNWVVTLIQCFTAHLLSLFMNSHTFTLRFSRIQNETLFVYIVVRTQLTVGFYGFSSILLCVECYIFIECCWMEMMLVHQTIFMNLMTLSFNWSCPVMLLKMKKNGKWKMENTCHTVNTSRVEYDWNECHK